LGTGGVGVKMMLRGSVAQAAEVATNRLAHLMYAVRRPVVAGITVSHSVNLTEGVGRTGTGTGNQ